MQTLVHSAIEKNGRAAANNLSGRNPGRTATLQKSARVEHVSPAPVVRPVCQRRVIADPDSPPWDFVTVTGASDGNAYDKAVAEKNIPVLLAYHTAALRTAEPFVPGISAYIDATLADPQGRDVLISQALHADKRPVRQNLVPEEEVHMTVKLSAFGQKKAQRAMFHINFAWNTSSGAWVCVGAYGTNLQGAQVAGTRQDFQTPEKLQAYHLQLEKAALSGQPGAEALLALWKQEAAAVVPGSEEEGRALMRSIGTQVEALGPLGKALKACKEEGAFEELKTEFIESALTIVNKVKALWIHSVIPPKLVLRILTDVLKRIPDFST
jgi:hypothetical protein